MDLKLDNKVIVVTGGANGIGEGIVRGVVDEEGIAVIIDRDTKSGEGLTAEIKSESKEAFFIGTSLFEPSACKIAVQQIVKKYGKIDALINNIGINDSVGLEKGSPQKFQQSVEQNLSHYYSMSHYCLSYLKNSKGSIVNIGSKVAVTGQGNTSGYAASKGAVLALTREWAVELFNFNVRVNAVVPAEVLTPQYEEWLAKFDNPQAKRNEITSRIPLGNRMTTTKEIADAVLFLISEQARNINGQFWFVDGGYVHLDPTSVELH